MDRRETFRSTSGWALEMPQSTMATVTPLPENPASYAARAPIASRPQLFRYSSLLVRGPRAPAAAGASAATAIAARASPARMALQLRQHVVGRGDLELAALLDVELGHDAVLDDHGVALRALAQ